MKKLTLALIASAVTLSAANAGIQSGFYLGAAAGYSGTNAKASLVTPAPGISGSSDIGSGTGNFGIHGGYGWVSGCLYVGGELAYTFENTKITNSIGTGGNFGQIQLKRNNGYFNAALRGGYLFTPATMGYIRVGANFSKWTLTNSLSGGFSNTNPATGSKSRVAFVPGVGIETAVARNVYLRVEYTYEFGPSVTATNNNVLNTASKANNIRTQTGKVGLSYKF